MFSQKQLQCIVYCCSFAENLLNYCEKVFIIQITIKGLAQNQRNIEEEKLMKTKKVISIGLAAMMSFTALTCSAATAYAEEKKDEVAGGKDVTISIMGRKVEIHDAMLEAADRYMELHPNVTVVMETVAVVMIMTVLLKPD